MVGVATPRITSPRYLRPVLPAVSIMVLEGYLIIVDSRIVARPLVIRYIYYKRYSLSSPLDVHALENDISSNCFFGTKGSLFLPIIGKPHDKRGSCICAKVGDGRHDGTSDGLYSTSIETAENG